MSLSCLFFLSGLAEYELLLTEFEMPVESCESPFYDGRGIHERINDMKKQVSKISICLSTLFTLVALASCRSTETSSQPVVSSSTPTSVKQSSKTSEESVAVKELLLELSKTSAKVGEFVTAKVSVKPTNATNKEYVLSSSDTSIASIEDGKIHCLSKGIVTITCRSKENPLKKAEAKLTVLGTDEHGRSENVFEAEDATLIPVEGSSLGVETTQDERVSNNSVVGKITKGDRILWGINADNEDDDAVLKIRMMGPSGWLGMWDSISCNFADFYTIKVNGKTLDTENVKIEGTLNRGSSADYYNMGDITLGKISLKKGLNVITFVFSNRYDTTTVNDDNYNGTLSCMGNIDNITVLSKSSLEGVSQVEEVKNADPDIIYHETRMEVEADTTRVYLGNDNPKADMSGKTSVAFAKNMSVMFGMKADRDMKVKLTMAISSPYKVLAEKMDGMPLSDLLRIDVDGKKVETSGMTLQGHEAGKTDFNTYVIGWISLKEGDSVLSLNVKNLDGYESLGSLDYVVISSIEGSITPFLNENPLPVRSYSFEAESDMTRRVGYDALEDGATYVELKDAYKTDTDKYKNKIETTKIIFGIDSDADSFATIKLRMSTPYVDAASEIKDVSLGNLGDLWVNGTMVSTPNTLKGTTKKGVKDNFTEVEIDKQIELHKGKNRIVWEPQNYTSENYAFLGAMDKITLESSATLKAYKVNFYTDRNTYMDNTKSEPVKVTLLEDVDGYDRSHCWIGLYRGEDIVEENQPGSLNWYYPSVGETFDILTKNPNDTRQLVPELGGYFKIVYMTYDSTNDKSGYPVYDTAYISCWNDPDQYGGYVQA